MLCLSKGDDLVLYSDRSAVTKKNRSRLAPAVQHPTRSLIIIIICHFGVLGQPHRCILCVWFALIFMTSFKWLLVQTPCHNPYFYELGGILVVGRPYVWVSQTLYCDNNTIFV